MLVAVDIGNTNIVLGFLDGDTIAGTYRITTKANHTSDEYGLFLTEFLRMSGFQPSDVDDVIICSVVPKVMHSFRSSIVKFLDIEPMVVGPGIKTGMNVRVDDPKSLGADILADCAGAYYEYGGPVLVADFGTATTFTHVSDKGVVRFGRNHHRHSCRRRRPMGRHGPAAGSGDYPTGDHFGHQYQTCMQAGLYYTFLGGVERTISQFRKELGGEDFKVITTGGLGRVFAYDTELIDVYDPDLIFKGMAHIYARNVK
ncbi:putative pantothenate kinase, type III [Bifidobacterium bifidum]|nr:putative pantothenate kinase, type III [Bifidobacterium bifidum]